MKKKSSIRLGPGASSLILIFIVLSMMLLGMLSLMMGRNDLKLSERSAEVIQAVYELNAEAEQIRSEIDNILVTCRKDATDNEAYLTGVEEALSGTDYEWEDGVVSFYVSDDYREIDCALKVLPLESPERETWVRYDLMAKTEDLWN